MEAKTKSTITDVDGKFNIQVEPGRYRCEVSVLGYEGTHEETLAITGRRVAVDFLLDEKATELETVTVTARPTTTDAQVVLPIEKVLRMPANFFDPVRMLTSYPGV